MQSPFSVVLKGSREAHVPAGHRSVETRHSGDRIEDGIVNIVAVVKILASRRGTSTSWRHQHVGSLNLPLCTDLACELIFRPLGCLVFARDRHQDDTGSC